MAPVTFNLNQNLRARTYDLYEQAGWSPKEYKDIIIEENGSQLSGLFEEYIAAIVRGKRIGGDQKDYDVVIINNVKKHWSKKIEVRSGSKNLNLGPSTSTGTNRYFEVIKAFKKLLKKETKCDSLIIFRLDTDHDALKIYEIPSKLVWGLHEMNVIGTEVSIPTDKVPQFIINRLGDLVKKIIKNKGNDVEIILTGMRNLCLSTNQFETIFPYEDYKFEITERHKMQDETPEECWRKAKKRSPKIKSGENKGTPKIEPKKCEGVFNREGLDYNALNTLYEEYDGKNAD